MISLHSRLILSYNDVSYFMLNVHQNPSMEQKSFSLRKLPPQNGIDLLVNSSALSLDNRDETLSRQISI
jgi:hypothetical protein